MKPALFQKRGRTLLLIAAVAVAALGIWLWPRGPEEPVYDGKRLGYWLEVLSIGCNFSQTFVAMQATRSCGTNALPWLMSEFTLSDSRWSAKWHRWIYKCTGWRPGRDTDRSWNAAIGLRLLGPDVVPALPELARYLDNPKLGSKAAHAMAGGGEAALPYLLQVINSTNPGVAITASNAVWQIDPSALPARRP